MGVSVGFGVLGDIVVENGWQPEHEIGHVSRTVIAVGSSGTKLHQLVPDARSAQSMSWSVSHFPASRRSCSS